MQGASWVRSCAPAWPLVLLLSSGAAGAQPSKSPAPSEEIGRFVVTGVRIDPALDNLQQRYFHSDPRLLGRLVTVEPQRLAIDIGAPCTRVRRQAMRRSIVELLRINSQRRNAAADRPPVPADYGLKTVPRDPIAMVTYTCTGPVAASGAVPGREWSGVTGFALGRDQRALLWGREVILLLQPIASPSPRPSYSCSKARTPAERTICADASLANWDRSVAAAYRLNMEGQGEDWAPVEDPGVLEESHRKWLADRNRCGTDRDCLRARMFEQTDALMRRQY